MAPLAAPVTMGSSPRLRGTLFVRAAIAFHLGIIPALAGNTPLFFVNVWLDGIIPALAGNTRAS